MKLHVAVFGPVDDVGRAYAERLDMSLAAFGVVALEYRHVGAAFVALEQETTDRGVLPHRSHDLDEVGAEGQQRIVQSIDVDMVVAYADLDSEYGSEIGNGGLEVRGSEAYLPQAQHAHLSAP